MSSIFHVRLKDFELQAERLMDAALRTRPVAIISSQQQDGTLVSVSSEAKEEGLYGGMKLSLARKMSHSALLMPYNRSLYTRLNSYLYKTVSTFTPIAEPAHFGQFYLDMTGMKHLYTSYQQAGLSVSNVIADKTSLASTIGISVNKLVSRISTAVVPDIINEIVLGEEPRFLSPLESPILPSVHLPQVKKMVQFLYLKQVNDIQKIVHSTPEGSIIFGKHFKQVARETQGKDTSAVRPPTLKDHIIEQVVIPKDTNDQFILRSIVKTMAEQIAFQLRKRQQIAKNVKLEIHYTDGLRNARHDAFVATNDKSIVETCYRLFDRANYRRNRIRTIIIDVSRFVYFANQTSLFEIETIKNNNLSKALDIIRRKHGANSIHSASALGNVPKQKSLLISKIQKFLPQDFTANS
jgi:nucleotidyltransferase/DNA polymerase involved in DNA repair